jgi:uncharacterized BrkB/YihY/UPF0761 family membrane protein
MRNEVIEKLVSFFLTLGVNLIVFFTSILFHASYYAPGNPIRPHRMDVDLVGLIGFYIGITQILYLLPVLYLLNRSRKYRWIEGMILSIVLTAFLNIVFLLTFNLKYT